MKSCISIQCPFIWYCNKFDRQTDRSEGCETQDRIMEGAAHLSKKQRAEARAIREREANAFNISDDM